VPGISPLIACAPSVIPWDWPTRGYAFAAAWIGPLVNWFSMAFGMPETDLSRQAIPQKCRKYAQLDILVFGMPKIDE
jgi:hypothetical protein